MKSSTNPLPPSLKAQQAWLQGRSMGQKGAWAEAARQFGKAFKLEPSDALYGMNLADALLKAGRAKEAAEAAMQALVASPKHPIALSLAANGLMLSMQYERLVEVLQEVPECDEGAELLRMRANAEVQIGRHHDAVGSYLQLLVNQPQDGMLHYNLGLVFNGLQLKVEAAECFRTALALGIGHLQVGVRDLLAFFERQVCDWRGGETQVEALRQSIASLPEDAAVRTNPFAHVTLLDDPAELLRAIRPHARFIEKQVTPLLPRKPHARDRIRVGYVSSDFHRHATSYLMANMFESHDRSRFEVFLYSLGKDDCSEIRARIRSAAEHFIDCSRTRAADLAKRVRDDGIDILVDLKGYTYDSMPELFAYRPAPVQVAYLGFPGTSGASFIDYVIGDRWVTPLEDAAHFSEKIAQLPNCYQCNDGSRPLPVTPDRESQGLPEDAVVLCGFNQPYKISPEVFDVWCHLLHRIPDAILWLLEWQSQAPPALRKEAEARGIDPQRLVFAPSVLQKDHLDRIGCADLFLDTWPCNGHTTASDMLWAGVPVVTFSGRTFASRVAGSLLQAVGVTETICYSLEDYEATALTLATDPSRRRALGARIQAARLQSTLFDGRLITRDIESLYERMWRRAVNHLPPEHLPASDER